MLGDPKKVKGVQLRPGYRWNCLWNIMVATPEDRQLILTSFLHVKDQQIPVFGSNPYDPANRKEETTKITFKDIPMNIKDETVMAEIKAFGIKPTSRVLTAYHREEDGSLSDFPNGDRFVYTRNADLIKLNIPRKVSISSFLCQGVHPDVQKSECKVCGEKTHLSGDPLCKEYLERSGVLTFYGPDSPLSNMFPVKFQLDGVTYSSSEHAYQAQKAVVCGRDELAEQILMTDRPFQAKRIGSTIKNTELWFRNRILRAKYLGDQECKQALHNTSDCVLAESNPYDRFWGTGLNKQQTLHTRTKKLPGSNINGTSVGGSERGGHRRTLGNV